MERRWIPGFAVGTVLGARNHRFGPLDLWGLDLDDVLEGFDEYPEQAVMMSADEGSSPTRITLPVDVAKKLGHVCLYSGCATDSADDSDYCEAHEAHELGRAATRQRRFRQRLAAAGLCIAQCGRKVPRRRKPGGGFVQRRCTECQEDLNEDRRAKRRVTGDERRVTGEPDDAIHWRVQSDTRVERVGQTTLRYVGHSRRGRLTREEQAAENIRDARFAIAEIEKFIAAIGVYMSPEVQALPRIQRDEAKRLVRQYLGTAGRFLDELDDKYGER